MGVCFIEIDCRIAADKRREFTLSAASLTPTSGEGRVKTVIYQDRDEPDHLLWVEEWSAQELLDKHLISEAFAILLGGLNTFGTIADCRVIHEAGEKPIDLASSQHGERNWVYGKFRPKFSSL